MSYKVEHFPGIFALSQRAADNYGEIVDLKTNVSELDSKFASLESFVIKNVRVGPSSSPGGVAGNRSRKKRHSRKKKRHSKKKKRSHSKRKRHSKKKKRSRRRRR